jgi:hypothetical protein
LQPSQPSQLLRPEFWLVLGLLPIGAELRSGEQCSTPPTGRGQRIRRTAAPNQRRCKVLESQRGPLASQGDISSFPNSEC